MCSVHIPSSWLPMAAAWTPSLLNTSTMCLPFVEVLTATSKWEMLVCGFFAELILLKHTPKDLDLYRYVRHVPAEGLSAKPLKNTSGSSTVAVGPDFGSACYSSSARVKAVWKRAAPPMGSISSGTRLYTSLKCRIGRRTRSERMTCVRAPTEFALVDPFCAPFIYRSLHVKNKSYNNNSNKTKITAKTYTIYSLF